MHELLDRPEGDTELANGPERTLATRRGAPTDFFTPLLKLPILSRSPAVQRQGIGLCGAEYRDGSAHRDLVLIDHQRLSPLTYLLVQTVSMRRNCVYVDARWMMAHKKPH